MFARVLKISKNMNRLILNDQRINLKANPVLTVTLNVHHQATSRHRNELKINKHLFHLDFTEDNFLSEVGNTTFWRQKMRTIHNLLDVNKDGVISFDDFKLLADRFVHLGHLSGKQQAQFYKLIEDLWIEQWGNNHTYNFITIEEYLNDMKHVVNDKDRRKRVHVILPYLFSAVDKDHDNTISFSEYQLFFKCLGLCYKDAAVAFESIDANKDGQLTIKEFVQLGRQYFLCEDENEVSKHFWGPLAP